MMLLTILMPVSLSSTAILLQQVWGSGPPWTGLCVSILTTTAFASACLFLHVTRRTVPATAAAEPQLTWRWINLLLSLIHSTISGLWTVYCVLVQPSLITDMILMKSRSAYFLASFSHGYFVYDLLEMVRKIRYRGSIELVLHHVLVITCMSVCVLYDQYLGFAVVSLAVEVSNVFLHSRSLMKIAGLATNGLIYSIHRWINLAFFVVFRLLVMLFLVYCMFKFQPSASQWVFVAGIICGIVVLVLSAFLMYRLIRSDFWQRDDNSVRDGQKVGSAESNGCMTGTAVAAGDQMSQTSADDPILAAASPHQQRSLTKKIS